MKSNFSRMVKRVQHTQNIEINCSACLDQVSQYVDLELSTGRAADRMPQVKQHLDQCGVCFDEYQILRQLATLELEDHLPDLDDLKGQLKGSSE
jgi:hypothetical protein